MEGNSYGRFDIQGSMRDLRPNGMNQHHLISQQNPMSEDNEPCLSCDDHNKNQEKNSPWQRVKWMDKMVKLMITVLSYIGEDSELDNVYAKKFAVLQKKGKWKSVSHQVMEERGYHVSPQQCEDKFNDLNKRYKKLNQMLGKGTSCEVVENPALLDKIDYLNEKEKDQVRKIMNSKHLFYEEMCSYHNRNRLHLPHDPALQRSLLRSLDDNHEHAKHQNQDLDDDYVEHHLSYRDCRGIHHGALGAPLKRLRQSQSHKEVGHPNKRYVPRSQAAGLQRRWIESKSLELEGRKLQIQAEFMELERQRFKWERFSKKRDQKLKKMRIENERLTLALKRIEMGAKL